MEQTSDNATGLMETQSKSQQPTDLSLLVLGTDKYTPTQLQTQTLLEYLQDETGLTPNRILVKNGHCADNWWLWPKRYPGFIDWWNKIVEQVFTDQRLNDLYKALYMRGLQQDTAAVKLLMQRFDPKYIERSQSDQRLSFAGYEPAAADDSRERQRKALASTALLDGPEQRTGGADTPALPEPAQAQAQEQAQEPGPVERIDNDTIADSKPITPIEGAGEGV